MLALVAEMLGDGGGIGRALHAQERRRIGRCRHHHGAAAVLRAQDVLDEFLDLAAALADQADHDHIGLRVARHHAQQHALAHARAGKQAQALAAPHGEQRVDGAHAGVQRLAHRVALHGVDLAAVHGLGHHVLHRAAMVQRQALRIDHAAQQAVAHRQAQHADGVDGPRGLAQARRRHIGRRRHHAGAAREAMDVPRRHQEGAVGRKAHHLRQDRRCARHLHQALRAHGHADARGFQHQAREARQGAARFQRRGLGHALARVRHEARPVGGGVRRVRCHRRPLRWTMPTPVPAGRWRAASACPGCHRPRRPPPRPGSPRAARPHRPATAPGWR